MSTEQDQFDVFPWNKSFETEIPLIDQQHRVLVDLLNKLANCLIAPNTIEVNAVYDALADYAALHFKDEEAIWFESFKDDPWAASHKIRHAAFLPVITDIKERNNDRGLSDVIEEIVQFLIRWLALHIMDDDKRMAFAVKAVESGVLLEDAKIIADEKMSGSTQVFIEAILKMYNELSSRTLGLMRERNTRIQAELKLKEINANLQVALAEVKTLQGIISICSYCHSIRDYDGAWERVEAYLSKYSHAEFSHGICPKCLVKVRQEAGFDDK